eukprot:TRINITY_DN8114_c0_g1_i2.p1 TRINITY_DN8114_c0_g1~~TRINITY_DN8114_c0_g1_i2.p1  ORF type:complete len:184 (-),score=27.22 TRINITY_DN8114_c0_g1_i2:14-544(-)
MSESKVNIYDHNAVKQILDDHVVKILTDSGYKEDTSLSNVKIVLGLISCGVAALSHYYPVPFPNNQLVLLVCVISYSICSLILQYIASYKEKDIFYFTHARDRYSNDAIQAASSLAKYDEFYTLSFARKGKGTRKVDQKQSYAKYFYSDGVFANEVFEKDVKTLLSDYQKNKKKEQ